MASSHRYVVCALEPRDGKHGTSIVCFPNGPPPAATMVPDAEGDRELNFAMFKHAEKRRATWRAVVGETEAIRYEAAVNTAGRHDARIFVGLADRESGKVTIVPSDAVYGLTQSIRRGVKHSAPDTSDMSERDRLQLLINTFGSKKRQAEQRSRAANRVDADMVAGGAAVQASLEASAASAVNELHQAAAGAPGGAASGQGSLDRAAMESRLRVLPPFNLDARSPAEAFPIDGLVTSADLDALRPRVKEIFKMIKKPKELEKACEGDNGFGNYVKVRMQALKTKSGEERATHGMYLLYLHALLRLSRQPFMLRAYKPSQLAETLEVPEVIAEKFLSAFAEPLRENGLLKYTRSKVLRDKLAFHILALALHLEGFEMDLALMAAEMKLSPRELGDQIRQLGCTVTVRVGKGEDGTSETTALAKLAVPLEFPRPRRKRARQ